MYWYGLLPRILNMSMTSSIIILSVLICRFILRKAPKKYSYILWSVVLFRLLCPLSFSAPVSLLGIFNTPIVTAAVPSDIDETGTQKAVHITSYVEYIPSNIVHTENPTIALPISGTDGTIGKIVNDSLPKGEEQIVADPLEVFISLATYLWILGVIVMVGKGCLSYIKLRRQLLGSLHYKSNIYIADYIPTPFVLGVFRPKIYLPSGLEEKEYKYIIQHEKCHIRRGDTLYKILAYFALCIHWFNPLVWLAFRLFVKDMEMSCDEAVIKKMGVSIRTDYAASILEFASGQKVLFGAPLAFGESEPAGRIKNLSKWKKPTVIVSVTAVVVCCSVIVICVFNPQHEKRNNQSEEIEIATESNVNESIVIENEAIVSEEVREIPSKEDVLSMREKVLDGMSDDEISRLRENIKVANLVMERAYLNDNLFTKLSDKDSPYWLYFDQKGDIQLGWWYNRGIFSKESIMKAENISEEEFAERFTEPGIVYNRFDADNFIALISDMQTSVQNKALKSDLQQLIDLTYLAKDTHEMEYANEIYKILHDMDYFLLRYGIEDVGKYTRDLGTVSTYYGVLVVYGATPIEIEKAEETSMPYAPEDYGQIVELRKEFPGVNAEEVAFYYEMENFYVNDTFEKASKMNDTLQKIYSGYEQSYIRQAEFYKGEYVDGEPICTPYDSWHLLNLTLVNNQYISIRYNNITYMGGAHPYSQFDAITIDCKTGEEVSASEILGKSDDEILQKVSKEMGMDETASWENIDYYLTDSTIVFFYRMPNYWEDVVWEW